MWWPDRVHIAYRTAVRTSIAGDRARSATYGCRLKMRAASGDERAGKFYLPREWFAHSDELDRRERGPLGACSSKVLWRGGSFRDGFTLLMLRALA